MDKNSAKINHLKSTVGLFVIKTGRWECLQQEPISVSNRYFSEDIVILEHKDNELVLSPRPRVRSFTLETAVLLTAAPAARGVLGR